MRPRIAILADFPWSYFDHGALGRGGGQACTWLPQLAEAFATCTQYEFHWITLDRSSSTPRNSSIQWREQFFHRIPATKVSIDLALGYLPSKIAINRILDSIQPGIIHCWGTERSYPVALGYNNIPSILSMQGVLSALRNRDLLPSTWYWRTLPKREPLFLNRATMITCESSWARDRVLEITPKTDVRIVEYGVHPDFYNINWDPDTTNPYALYAGSLSNAKGIDILLSSLALLPSRNWELRLAGNGPLAKKIESSGLSGIRCLGELGWHELQQQMRHALCLVHPTRADSGPSVAKEARVIGLPIITSRHCGAGDYLRHRENGMIVDPLTPEELSAALSFLMDQPEIARTMGDTRHAEDRTHLLSSKTANVFLETYDELLRSRYTSRTSIQD